MALLAETRSDFFVKKRVFVIKARVFVGIIDGMIELQTAVVEEKSHYFIVCVPDVKEWSVLMCRKLRHLKRK